MIIFPVLYFSAALHRRLLRDYNSAYSGVLKTRDVISKWLNSGVIWKFVFLVALMYFLFGDVCLGVGLLLEDLLVTWGVNYLDPHTKSNSIWSRYSYFLYGSGDNHRESLVIIHLECFLTTRVHIRLHNCFCLRSVSKLASFTLF